MTQAQYAAHRSVSRQYISNLARRGVLVMRGRLVDVQASDAVLDDKPETATINQQPTSYAQDRLAREIFSAKLKKLEYEMKSGKLIPADERAYVAFAHLNGAAWSYFTAIWAVLLATPLIFTTTGMALPERPAGTFAFTWYTPM